MVLLSLSTLLIVKGITSDYQDSAILDEFDVLKNWEVAGMCASRPPYDFFKVMCSQCKLPIAHLLLVVNISRSYKLYKLA